MRVSEALAEVKGKGEKALIPFVTAGDPDLESLGEILRTLESAGADVIEVGVPFSDPIADGPTIQASSQRALERGVKPKMVLEAVKTSGVKVPIVLMGYYNTVLRWGLREFAHDAHDSGVRGMIMCDLIPEEADDWIHACTGEDVETIFLAAPTSTDARLDGVCEHSSGFVYAVSRTGVTGARDEGAGQARELVDRLKARTKLPICVGFGISNQEHIRQVCEFADGAVVGSFLVDLIAREWKGGEGKQLVLDTVAALKGATR